MEEKKNSGSKKFESAQGKRKEEKPAGNVEPSETGEESHDKGGAGGLKRLGSPPA